MSLFKVDVYVDDIFVKTVYREGHDQAEVEHDVFEGLDLTLDAEEQD